MELSRPPLVKLDTLPQVAVKDPINPTYVWADLDTAKDLQRALEVLPDHLRLEWLNWCCEQASIGEMMRFRLQMIPKDIVEYLVNVYQMIGHGQLTMERCVQGAEYLARKTW